MKICYACPNCGARLASLTEAAREAGMGINQLKHRIYRKGMTMREAVAAGSGRLKRKAIPKTQRQV